MFACACYFCDSIHHLPIVIRIQGFMQERAADCCVVSVLAAACMLVVLVLLLGSPARVVSFLRGLSVQHA